MLFNVKYQKVQILILTLNQPQINTFYYMMIILSILTVTHISMTVTIVFGDLTGKELVVSGTLVALTLIGSFGLIRVTKNFKLLLLEMDEKLANTNFGKETKDIPVDRLGVVFAGLFLINAVIQLTNIYS